MGKYVTVCERAPASFIQIRVEQVNIEHGIFEYGTESNDDDDDDDETDNAKQRRHNQDDDESSKITKRYEYHRTKNEQNTAQQISVHVFW